jgi:hypothetical protein
MGCCFVHVRVGSCIECELAEGEQFLGCLNGNAPDCDIAHDEEHDIGDFLRVFPLWSNP